MRIFLAAGVALVLWSGAVNGQVPAQPADPNQGMPAQPVQPAPVPVPPVPSAAVPSASLPAATIAAPTGPVLSIIGDSSLKAVLQELAQTWADSLPSSPQIPLTLTNAGTMMAKVDAGGTWDLLVDADVTDVKAMTDRSFLLADGQRSLARNFLLVYGRAPLVKDDDQDWYDLIGTEWKKVAVGNADLTASGRVARRALQKHDLLDEEHKGALVNAATEAAELQLLQRQQADAAFIYTTDLPNISLPGFQPFPVKTEDAPPIFYTAAIFRLAKNPDLARAFIQYCSSPAARPIWARYGFETD